MRLGTQFRAVFSTISLVLLMWTLVSGECAACGVGVAASLQNGGCCEPDGQCKASHDKVPPPRCVKGHASDFAEVHQVLGIQPLALIVNDLTHSTVYFIRVDNAPAIALSNSPPDLLGLITLLRI